MKEQITYDIYDKVDIRVGTVISVKKNEKARKPSLVVEVDFGKDIGIKQSSAQITHYYNEENLVGKQVIGICNFPKKNIAGIVSQVLILGSIDEEGKVVLVNPSQKVENGLPVAYTCTPNYCLYVCLCLLQAVLQDQIILLPLTLGLITVLKKLFL